MKRNGNIFNTNKSQKSRLLPVRGIFMCHKDEDFKKRSFSDMNILPKISQCFNYKFRNIIIFISTSFNGISPL